MKTSFYFELLQQLFAHRDYKMYPESLFLKDLQLFIFAVYIQKQRNITVNNCAYYLLLQPLFF